MMPERLAFIFETVILIFIVWLILFLSTLLHEIGHAAGYMIATGDGHWSIRVGSGRRLFSVKRLTVKMLPFDGCFVPSEKGRIDTTAKLISMLSGGPAVSLILVVLLIAMRSGYLSMHTDVISDGAAEFLLNTALWVNSVILILSLIPIHYFHGEIKGMETDGLQIVNAVRNRKDR